ncbi:hypothetical protein [Methyloversatilis universalis]|uniref:hypothetical protein n=1 Tax=Methyloversatilis universalis TaxID=378211 RepID=UPI000367C647|nr:hypothetical protein [Methyloversatilis universalis]
MSARLHFFSGRLLGHLLTIGRLEVVGERRDYRADLGDRLAEVERMSAPRLIAEGGTGASGAIDWEVRVFRRCFVVSLLATSEPARLEFPLFGLRVVVVGRG